MEQLELLRYALGVLDSQGIPNMLVGSMASMAYGEPRLTRDIDLVIDLRAAQVEALCDAFPAPDFYVSRSAAADAVARYGQFNIIHPASGNKIDLMIRGDAWGQSQLARRRQIAILPDLNAMAAAPEDVILGKLLYYNEGRHEKHLRDIASMLRISGDEIDESYIGDWAGRLGLAEIWKTILRC